MPDVKFLFKDDVLYIKSLIDELNEYTKKADELIGRLDTKLDEIHTRCAPRFVKNYQYEIPDCVYMSNVLVKLWSLRDACGQLEYRLNTLSGRQSEARTWVLNHMAEIDYEDEILTMKEDMTALTKCEKENSNED